MERASSSSLLLKQTAVWEYRTVIEVQHRVVSLLIIRKA
ncbi:hypothetical protein VCR6J2_610310 [Vibrio coralliirubri]|nr:hypothetical protein VCR6J2_610310 [Vibrio coralliirubri]CDT83406.1 hypothetical protein VCR8J2_240035 [Vibrio coralliirubri]